MTANRKEIVASLDLAARRAADAGISPATGKQCWFLAGLMGDAGDDRRALWGDSDGMLSKKDASRFIDEYLAQAKKKAA